MYGRRFRRQMTSIYDLKPRFQNLLRPMLAKLGHFGITPNTITWLHSNHGTSPITAIIPWPCFTLHLLVDYPVAGPRLCLAAQIYRIGIRTIKFAYTLPAVFLGVRGCSDQTAARSRQISNQATAGSDPISRPSLAAG